MAQPIALKAILIVVTEAIHVLAHAIVGALEHKSDRLARVFMSWRLYVACVVLSLAHVLLRALWCELRVPCVCVCLCCAVSWLLRVVALAGCCVMRITWFVRAAHCSVVVGWL